MSDRLPTAVIEQRSCYVRTKEPGEYDWPIFDATFLRTLANELGMQPIDLSLIRAVLRAWATERETEQSYVVLGCCEACGMSFPHVPYCPKVREAQSATR